MLTFPLRCQARSEAGAARILLSITQESSRGLQLPQIHGGIEGATALHHVQVVGLHRAEGAAGGWAQFASWKQLKAHHHL